MPFHSHFVFCLHYLDSKKPYANTSSSWMLSPRQVSGIYWIAGKHTHTPFNPSSLTALLAPSDCDFVNDVNR